MGEIQDRLAYVSCVSAILIFIKLFLGSSAWTSKKSALLSLSSVNFLGYMIIYDKLRPPIELYKTMDFVKFDIINVSSFLIFVKLFLGSRL